MLGAWLAANGGTTKETSHSWDVVNQRYAYDFLTRGEMHEKQVRSAAGTKLLAELRQLCARLSEVTEEIDGFGHTSFRVGRKSFVIVGEEGGQVSLAIQADPVSQAALIRRGPYYRTPYIGQHGWVSIADRLEENLDEIRELVQGAYLRTAPKRLVKMVSED